VSVLLDVNVLIAILDTRHVHHDFAQDWFLRNGASNWSTCPLTENGAIRILSDRTYPNSTNDPAIVIETVAALRATGIHAFWPDAISLLDSPLIDRRKLAASKQVTDSYLLALAVSRGGRLATFDRRLSPVAVAGGPEALLILDNRH